MGGGETETEAFFSSHEAPFSQPERSLVLFRAFLASRPLPESFE